MRPLLLQRCRSVHTAVFTLTLVAITACSTTQSGGRSANPLTDLISTANASGYSDQATAMSDGVVTDAELINGAVGARACAKAAGADVSSITQRPDGTIDYSFAVPEGADQNAIVNAADQCQDVHLKLLELAYARTTSRPKLLDLVKACLQRRGHIDGLDPSSLTQQGIGRALATAQDPASRAITQCNASSITETVIVE